MIKVKRDISKLKKCPVCQSTRLLDNGSGSISCDKCGFKNKSLSDIGIDEETVEAVWNKIYN